MPCPCVSYELPYQVSFRFQAMIDILHNYNYYTQDQVK